MTMRHFYPDGGGAEMLAYRLASELRRSGVPIVVLTGGYGKRRRVAEINGVPIIRHFIGGYVPVIHELCYLASLTKELICRRYCYDVVHVFQTQLSALVAGFVAKKMGKAVIATCHSAGRDGDLATWSSALGRALLKVVFSTADAVTAVSRELIGKLYEAGLDRVKGVCIPNGTVLPYVGSSDRADVRSKLGLDADQLIVLCVGRLAAPKTPELLIDAWSVVSRRMDDSLLLFLGDGPKMAALKDMTKKAGLEGSVFFSGRVNNVDEYLRAADVFVLASSSEGMPLAVLEAMAAGLPIAAADVGGIREIVISGENGFLFPAGDRDRLIDCLSQLLECADLRKKMGREARDTIKRRYTLKAMVDAYIALYASVEPRGER